MTDLRMFRAWKATGTFGQAEIFKPEQTESLDTWYMGIIIPCYI